jgi:PAS domain S-box-containing protein
VGVLGFSAVLLGLLISWIWYAPLRRLTLAARSMASGSLRTRAHIRGSDELGELAQALDEMRENLARQIDLIATQRADLQTVVSTLREGIIATDARDRVVLVNNAAYEMLDVEDNTGLRSRELGGQHVQSIVRVADIMDLYRTVCRQGRAATRQIETDVLGHMRTLQVTVSRVEPSPAEGLNAIIVIHDISDIARAAAMKSEFVANASHELRTPLATIRAAVESLAGIEPGEEEMFRKLVDILSRHVQRLENMTVDLLNLHVVATENVQLHSQEISAESLVNWVRNNYASTAAGKDLELKIDLEDPDLTIESDRKLLEMILQNLLDNALKFTGKGHVRLRIAGRDQRVVIQVEDTGCGIRPEEQSRVFERFYQADQARSGDTQIRGTGLGLAIVKHAAESLGAMVKLESRIGLGTTVTLSMPRTGE